MTPYESVDLTDIVEESEGRFLVLRSPESAEDSPDYELVADCPTLQAAQEVLAGKTDLPGQQAAVDGDR